MPQLQKLQVLLCLNKFALRLLTIHPDQLYNLHHETVSYAAQIQAADEGPAKIRSRLDVLLVLPVAGVSFLGPVLQSIRCI